MQSNNSRSEISIFVYYHPIFLLPLPSCPIFFLWFYFLNASSQFLFPFLLLMHVCFPAVGWWCSVCANTLLESFTCQKWHWATTLRTLTISHTHAQTSPEVTLRYPMTPSSSSFMLCWTQNDKLCYFFSQSQSSGFMKDWVQYKVSELHDSSHLVMVQTRLKFRTHRCAFLNTYHTIAHSPLLLEFCAKVSYFA